MTLLALIKDDEIVSTFPDTIGRVDLPGVGQVSPPVAGWEGEGFRIAEIVLLDVPEGKRRVNPLTYEVIDGVPTETTALEDILPPPVPDVVSRRQFMMQLHIAGLKASVEAWVEQQDDLTQIAYRESATFQRSDPMMQAGFAALGYTEQQGDEFFTAASAL